MEILCADWQEYEIMHGNQKVASVCRNGICNIYMEEMLPYNLYLEQVAEEDIDGRIQNLDNFYHWCASRILTLDREFAKEILNSIGATQSATDKERAQIALSYHCLSLMDIFWTKEKNEQQNFSELNLFENHLESAFVDVSLRGRQMTIQNRHLIADDLGTQGCYPKAWIRKQDGFWLMKDGGLEPVEHELLASRIARCFRVNQVEYEESFDMEKYKDYEIVESRNTSNIRANDVGQIKGETGKGMIQASSIYVKKDQSINIMVSVTPSDKTVRVGIVDSNNKIRFVYGKGTITHEFAISASDYYKPVVINDATSTISVNGTYYVN